MGQSMLIIDQRRDEIIAAAIAKQTLVTITHRRPDGWRVYKAEFMGGAKSSGQFQVTPPEGRGEVDEGLPPVGEVLGVTFRVGHKKCMFSSRCLESAGAYTLKWPEHIQQVQRRVYQRVSPPGGQIVPVKFWQSSGEQAMERKRDVRYGELEDLSAGGMRVNAAEAGGLQMDQTFECLFTPRAGAPPIIAEVTLRHREAAEQGRASLGFQFIGLETSDDGQDLLARIAMIVSEYQKARKRSD